LTCTPPSLRRHGTCLDSPWYATFSVR
jgi:hypothetical protein